MGTDSIRLFDIDKCRRILSAPLDELFLIVGNNEELLEQAVWSSCRPETTNLSIDGIRGLIRDDSAAQGHLRAEFVIADCFPPGKIHLDYWACYAEVFSSQHPVGSIFNTDLLPFQEEGWFLLLGAEDVDTMLRSLDAHRDEVRIMNEEQIARLRSIRDICRSDERWKPAYIFDY
jgi:hypothetical protein